MCLHRETFDVTTNNKNPKQYELQTMLKLVSSTLLTYMWYVHVGMSKVRVHKEEHR